MTKEEFDFCAEYEKQFSCALDSGYLKGVPMSTYKRFNEIAGMSENPDCGDCAFRLVTAVARMYRNEKEEREERQRKDERKADDRARRAAKKEVKV